MCITLSKHPHAPSPFVVSLGGKCLWIGKESVTRKCFVNEDYIGKSIAVSKWKLRQDNVDIKSLINDWRMTFLFLFLFLNFF